MIPIRNDTALMIQPYSQQPITNVLSPDYYFTSPPPATPFDPTMLMNDFSRSHQRAASSTYPHTTTASSTDRFLPSTLQPIYNNNPTMRCSAATTASTCSTSSPFAFDSTHSVLAPQSQPTSMPFADDIATQR